MFLDKNGMSNTHYTRTLLKTCISWYFNLWLSWFM